MNKIFILCIFGILNLSAFSQINLNDSTVNAIGYWDRGEKQNYELILKSTDIIGDEVVIKDSTVYDIEISILDSTETSYTIQWLYAPKISYTNKEYSLKDILVNYPKNYRVLFKTNELGVFEELLNTTEIRDSIKSHTRAESKRYRGDLSNEDLEQIIERNQSILLTEEAIKNIALVDIQQYYSFFGLQYKLGESYNTEIEMPNAILPDKPFITDFSYGLERLYSDESYIMKSEMKCRKEDLEKTALGYLKQINPSITESPIQLFRMKNQIEDLNLQNKTIVYSQIHNSGWVLYSIATKETNNGEKIEIKETSLELILDE